MRTLRPVWSFALLIAIVAAVHVLTAQETAAPWKLPTGFPAPLIPADNPLSESKIALGRLLFYDTRLSGNGTQSCGTCHEQARAFTDGRAQSVGSTGQLHRRGSMSLVNIAYASALTWANPSLTRLEDQALVPMYGARPIELGLDQSDRWLDTLKRDPKYPTMFRAAFGDQPDSIIRDNVVKAIASFERSIVSARSPYDRYHFERDDTAISAAARRGEVLFHSRPLSCFTCHGGAHFSNSMGSRPRSTPIELNNTGLYNLAGLLSFPASDAGLYDVTHDARDVGKFKAPTLRNIAVTAPYMHDGSVATLEEAIDHYAAGGRTISSGPNQGVGHDNPNKNPSIQGFPLKPEDRADLVAFLKSLTDDELLRDPQFANPWIANKP